MNQGIFKVIFNRTLNRFVVVSELAKAAGKGSERAVASSGQFLQKICKIRPLVFGLMHALGWVSMPLSLTLLPSLAVAETLIIKADPTAPKAQQPIILQTANGLPQVNIQTPNDKGLSHNKYAKFDVAEKGAILNNSRKAVQTQQGGWVQGNPYLARGEAKVILNEVNSTDPSVLKGYVEVAGQKAEVIIANPAGLHCDGCGVINAARSTFTTGKPQVVNGQLESLVVEKGQVSVSGKGLDNSRVDYSEIIAREAQVNAGIWAGKEMAVVTGKNTVKRTDKRSDSGESLQIIHTNQPLAGEPTPEFALDVGELGGMYAGKIHLIGTENGVGVRNAGHIGAGSDSLKIDSQGRILNLGAMNAEKDVVLGSPQEVENQGKIENRTGNIKLESGRAVRNAGSVVARGGNVEKRAAQSIEQRGETVARGHIRYQAKDINVSHEALLAAGVSVEDSPQGEVRSLNPFSAQGRSLDLSAGGKATVNGKQIATGKASVSATELDFSNSSTLAHEVDFNATLGSMLLDSATIEAKSALALSTPVQLNTAQAHLSALNWRVAAARVDNQKGTWIGQGATPFALTLKEGLNNLGGTLLFKQDIAITTPKTIENSEGVIHSFGGNLTLSGQHIENRKGELSAVKGLTLNAESLSSWGDIHAFDTTLNLKTGFESHTDIKGANSLSIRAQGQFINHAGLLSQGNTSLQAQSIDNLANASIQGANVALISENNLTNRGLIKAGGSALIKTAQTLHNIGTGRIYGWNIALQADKLVNEDERVQGKLHSAVIAAHNRLDIGVKEVLNQHTAINPSTEKSGVTLSSGGEMAFGRELNDENRATGKAESLVNSGALIESEEGLQLNVAEVLNQNPTIRNVMTEKSRENIHESFLISGNSLRDGERINFNLLKWISFSRAGKVVYKAEKSETIDPNNLTTQILPMPNEEVCLDIQNQTGCSVNANARYLADDPIWDYFSTLKRPLAEPPKPDLTDVELEAPEPPEEPTPPRRVGFSSSVREAEYQARLAEYHQKLAEYEKAKADYAEKRESYSPEVKAYLNWLDYNTLVYEELSKAIEQHNSRLRGREFSRFWVNEVNERVTKEDVVTDSLPGQILAGGNLQFSGNFTNNQSTVIAGGTIRNTENATQTVQNHDQWGERVIEDYGTEQWTWSRWRGGFKRYHQRDWGGKHAYMHETRRDIPLNIVRTETSGQLQKITQNPPLVVEGVELGAKEIRSIGVDTRLPSSSQYRVQPNPDSQVLIETDPAFTDHHRWLGGDYMLNVLRTDHDKVHKRLGDAPYEQKLVQEQINRLTGKMYLDDYRDFESQFKALMDAGISVAKRFNLRPGIRLSPEQVAQLTSDIVWFEEESITLADGSVQTVLVPKVYVVADSTLIAPQAALISANKLSFNLDKLFNHGAFLARNISIKTQGGLNNVGGIVKAEKQVFINSQDNLLLGNHSVIHVNGKNGIFSIIANKIYDDGSAVLINENPGISQVKERHAPNKKFDLNNLNSFRRNSRLHEDQIFDKVTKGLSETEKQNYTDAKNALLHASAHLPKDDDNYKSVAESEKRGNAPELKPYRDRLLTEKIDHNNYWGSVKVGGFSYDKSDKESDRFRRENAGLIELAELANPFDPAGKIGKVAKAVGKAGKYANDAANWVGDKAKTVFSKGKADGAETGLSKAKGAGSGSKNAAPSNPKKKGFRPLETLKNKEKEIKEKGKYGHLKEPRNVKMGADFTRAQKKRILEENRRVNGGRIVSDHSGKVLNSPKQSRKGVKSDMEQAEVDHVIPKSKGGTNSNANARVTSKKENLEKGNKSPNDVHQKDANRAKGNSKEGLKSSDSKESGGKGGSKGSDSKGSSSKGGSKGSDSKGSSSKGGSKGSDSKGSGSKGGSKGSDSKGSGSKGGSKGSDSKGSSSKGGAKGT